MEQLITPFWVKQRQCKLDPAGENAFKITAPNLGESYLRVFPDDGRWKAAVRTTVDGQDLYVTNTTFASAKDAWDGAFELYRNHFII